MCNKKLLKKGSARVLALLLAATLALPGTALAASVQNPAQTVTEEGASEDALFEDEITTDAFGTSEEEPEEEDALEVTAEDAEDKEEDASEDDTEEAVQEEEADTENAGEEEEPAQEVTDDSEDAEETEEPAQEEEDEAEEEQKDDADSAEEQEEPALEETDDSAVEEDLQETEEEEDADSVDDEDAPEDEEADTPEEDDAEAGQDEDVPEEADADLPADEQDAAEETAEATSDEEVPIVADEEEETVTELPLMSGEGDVNEISSIEIDSGSEYTVNLGLTGRKTYQMKINVKYATTDKATNQKYTLKSSDTSVITVTSTGKVTAVGKGSAYVGVYVGDDTWSWEDLYFEVRDKVFVVSYDVNGGTPTQTYYEDTFKTGNFAYDGGSVYLPDSYELGKKGYILKGWTTTKDGSTVLTDSYTPTKNITLYAKWAKAYTVKFNINGGKFESSYYGEDRVVEAGESVGLYTGQYVAKKSGYILKGWTVGTAGKTVFTYEYTPTKNVTLYAKWVKAYTVKFNINGGKFKEEYYGEPEVVASGDEVYLRSGAYVAEKKGYILSGWTVGKAGKTVFKGSYKPTKNVTLYAKWAKAYTVKFNANGGKFNSYYGEDELVEAGNYVSLSTGDYVAAKSGCILVGWTVGKSGKTVFKRRYTPTKNVTLYAKWAKAYTVKFNANGGEFTENYYDDLPKGVKVEAGTALSLRTGESVARKKGYILTGWKVKGGKTVFWDEYTPKKNITLYANWTKALTVTFNAGKGYFGEDKDKKITVKVAKGDTAGQYINDSEYRPTNPSSSFLGWYKDSKLKTPVKRSDVINKNTTFYAKYATKKYKITVTNLKGAYCKNNATGQYVDFNKNSFSYYIRQGDPIGHLYAYIENKDVQFYFDKACKQKPYYDSYIPTGNMTVYAKWRNEVYVRWDGNGGKNSYGDDNGWSESTKTLMCEELPERMYRDGYYFVGWYDAADSSKKVLPVSHVFNKDTDVKAKWAKGIKITFKAGGGTFDEEERTVFYMKAKTTLGSAKIYAPDVERKGYILKGWKSSVTKKLVKDLYSQKPSKATTYTAVWEKEKNPATVAVTLVAGAGSLYNSETGKYVTKLVVKIPKNTTYAEAFEYLKNSSHDDPTKRLSNYGWSKTKNGKELSAKYKFTKKVTLYPVWNSNVMLRVALVTNGGSLYGEPQNEPDVTYWPKGNIYELPTSKDMEREGYKFVGWYTDYKCTKKISKPSKYKVTKSCYLYAKWKKK